MILEPPRTMYDKKGYCQLLTLICMILVIHHAAKMLFVSLDSFWQDFFCHPVNMTSCTMLRGSLMYWLLEAPPSTQVPYFDSMCSPSKIPRDPGSPSEKGNGIPTGKLLATIPRHFQ